MEVILSSWSVLFVSSINRTLYIGFTAREARKKSSYFIITVSNSTFDVSEAELLERSIQTIWKPSAYITQTRLHVSLGIKRL